MVDTDASRKAKGFLSKLFARDFCGKPAVWHTCLGQDLCEEHAEEWVNDMQNPDATIHILTGNPPWTEEEARKRMTRIQ